MNENEFTARFTDADLEELASAKSSLAIVESFDSLTHRDAVDVLELLWALSDRLLSLMEKRLKESNDE